MMRCNYSFGVNAEITADLTQQDIDHVMTAALKRSIVKWCSRVKVVVRSNSGCTGEQISRGGSLMFYDEESTNGHLLTLGKFLNGVKLYYENGYDLEIRNGHIDLSNIDENDADYIIQFALFGEVRYA